MASGWRVWDFGAEEEAGGDVVLIGEAEGVAVVVGGEDPRVGGRS